MTPLARLRAAVRAERSPGRRISSTPGWRGLCLRAETSCWMLGDTLGVVGIDLNAQNSLMWNDFDCFECQDCDIRNPADIETSTLAPSTTSLPAVVTTSASPSIPTLCPNCHLKSSPSSDLVCEKIGNLGTVDLEPYANNGFDKATMQTNSEQCATICYQLDGCAASAHDAGSHCYQASS